MLNSRFYAPKEPLGLTTVDCKRLQHGESSFNVASKRHALIAEAFEHILVPCLSDPESELSPQTGPQLFGNFRHPFCWAGHAQHPSAGLKTSKTATANPKLCTLETETVSLYPPELTAGRVAGKPQTFAIPNSV